MARSGRAGNNPFAGPSGPQRGPNRTTNGPGGGGGLVVAAPRNRTRPSRPNNQPRRNRSGRGSTGDLVPPAADTGGVGGLDQADASNPFNDQKNYRQGAWGMLNNAGINQAGMSDAERAFHENVINDWVDQYSGLDLTQPNAPTFENWMYAQAGNPPTTPHPGGGPFGGLGGPGQGGGLPPNMGSAGVPANPDEAWRQNVYYPQLQRTLRARWAAATEQQRGYDNRNWRAPGHVIPF